MSGRLAVIGLGPGDPHHLTPEAEVALRDAASALRLWPLSRPRGGARRPKPPCLRQSRGRRARRERAPPRRARRACRRRLRRRSGRVRHGGGDLRSRSSKVRQAGARSMSRSFPASPRCLRWRRGSARRSATISVRCHCPTISSPGAWSSAGSTPPPRQALSSRCTTRCRGRGRGNSAMRWNGCAGICWTRRRSCSAARSDGRMSKLSVTTLGEADAVPADMATLIIVGTRETRVIVRPGRSPLVYTPRAAAEVSA